MVSYERLWKTMNQKKITQYRLIKYYEISAGQIGRLKKNMYVSTHTIELLCTILDCPVDQIMEVIPDPSLVEWKNRKENERISKLKVKRKNPPTIPVQSAADKAAE